MLTIHRYCKFDFELLAHLQSYKLAYYYQHKCLRHIYYFLNDIPGYNFERGTAPKLTKYRYYKFSPGFHFHLSLNKLG